MIKSGFAGVLGLLALTAMAVPASATVVASQSFETPALAPGQIQYGPDEFGYNTGAVGPVSISGVTFTGFSGIIINGALGVFPNATDGTQAAFVQSYLGTGGELDWAVSGLTPGESYTLSFDYASALIVPADDLSVVIFGGVPVGFTPGASYQTASLDFIPSTSSGSIDFIGFVGDQSQNLATALDNLTIRSVPEPASWTLLLAGLTALGLFAARRAGAKA